jgi:natural product precursor
MKIKKLVLKKTTIAALSDSNLKQIVGGRTQHSQCLQDNIPCNDADPKNGTHITCPAPKL